MSAYSPTHIPIPKNHADFESKSVALFRILLEDPSVKKLGRSGQKQYGIDLIGYRKADLEKPIGIQCKKKKPGQALTAKEVRDEVKKALRYRPHIVEYIIVTTADDDTALDKLAQELTKAQRDRGRKVRIQVWGWGTLEDHIDEHQAAKDIFDPTASPALKEVRTGLKAIAKNQDRQATAQQLAELSQKIDDQRSSLANEQLPSAFADKEIESELRIINSRRGFPEAKTADELAQLADRVLTGDLSRASNILRSDILERAARTHARPEDVTKAKAFHAAALKYNRRLDTSFFDALLPAAEGYPDKTLRALRQLALPEAKTAIFNQIFRTQGAKKALEWIAESKIKITDLDAGGALNVLLQKVETDDFDGALSDAEVLTAVQLAAIPSLHTVRCSLLLASALPKDLKRIPFQGLPINPRELRFASSSQTATTIARARADLDAALAVLNELRLVEIQPFLEEMALWLRLEDKGTHQAAVEQIAQEIKDPKKTLRRVRLALSYSIPFNAEALVRNLVAEKRVGNWTADEQFAAFLLAFYSGDLVKTAEFFDSYGGELYSQEHLAKGILVGIEIEALSRTGRFEEARERLARYHGQWVDDEGAAHLETLIASVESGNEEERLRKLYEEKGELNYLRLLVLALMNKSDHRQLAIYAPLLLRETKRVEDYEVSLKALFSDRQYSELAELAQQYPDLHRLKDDFCAFEGWALFNLGKVLEARKIVRTLVDRRDDPADRELDINTAIESGDWGRLQAIVTRESERASSLDPKLLVRLARLALESGSLYVDKFRDAAIANANNDPSVFLAAYQLSVERGEEYQESRAHVWFQQAVVLSGPDGPVQQVAMRDVLDRTAGWNKRLDDIDEMLASVKMPLYLAAQGLNRKPIEFILGTALRNSRATDPKEQFPILAFAGNRRPDELSGMRRAALDITALFTLDFLGLLQTTISAFDKIIISPTTLGSLFFERQSIRFHQPSLVAKAKRIKQLLSDGRIKVLRGEKTNAEKVLLDIDPDLKFLLDKARENKALVVRSAPVHKLRSMLEEVADMGSYSDVLTDTRAALDLVRARVIATTAENAGTYLAQVDKGWTSKPSITSQSVVYVDQLTITYLDYVGILEPFIDNVAEVYVTQGVSNEADAILRAAELSENLLAAIDRIRSALNAGLDKGNVVFSSRRRPGADDDDADHDAYDRRLPSLDIMADLSDIDVVVCDDRYLNKDLFWEDGTRRTPCANTLDLIYALNSRALISQPQKYGYLHRLREGGYHAVPVELVDLLTEITRAPVDQDSLVETPELAGVRLNQSLAIRARMLSPIESQWIDFSRMAIHQAIRQVWTSNSSLEAIVAQADWLLAIMPMPFRLVSDPTDESAWALAQQRTVTQLGVLLSPTVAERTRQQRYSEWIDQKLANPTRVYLPALMQEAIRTLALFFQRIVGEVGPIPTAVRRRFILKLISELHPKLENELLEMPGFAKSIALNVASFVAFDDSLAVSTDSFVKALKAALSGEKTALLKMKSGAEEKARLRSVSKDVVEFAFADRKLAIGDVELLSSTQAARGRASDRVFSTRPLTKSEESRWLAQCKKGLSPQDFINLSSALKNTPEHLTIRLSVPQSLGEAVLIPKDISYYTYLAGAVPKMSLLADPSALQAQQAFLATKGDVGLRRIAHASISHALIPFEKLERLSTLDLAKLVDSRNPFALVFGFELCRFRLSKGDKEAIALGTTFLKKLFASKRDLQSRCELLSACAIISMVSLRPTVNAANAPLDWFRFAALSHAGVLTDALRNISKIKNFFKWAWEQYAGAYWWNTFVDTQEEPKWELEWLLPDGLTAELIGRCHQAMILLPQEMQPREWTVVLNKALKGLDPSLRAFFPGPLDGFRPVPPGEGAGAAREDVRKILRDRDSFRDAPGLVLLAQSGAIDRELSTEIVRLLEASDEQLVKLGSAYPALKCSSYVASTTRNGGLAQAVIARCLRLIAADTTPDEFLQILLLALRACSAYDDRKKYYREVGRMAVQFAYLASREAALEMRKSLEIPYHRDVRLMGSLGRAMAILEAKYLS